jgi:hypothetical protein
VFSNFLLFIRSVIWLHLTLLAGCVMTVAVGLFEKYVIRKALSLPVYSAMVGALLFFACFQAWQEEYTSRIGRESDLNLRNSALSTTRAEMAGKNKLLDEYRDRLALSNGGIRIFEKTVSPAESPLSLRERTLELSTQLQAFNNTRMAMMLPSPSQGGGSEIIENRNTMTQTDAIYLKEYVPRLNRITGDLNAAGVDVDLLRAAIATAGGDTTFDRVSIELNVAAKKLR